MDSNEFEIVNQPDANDVWSGIGGYFTNITQIICEFVDNSISNFVANDTPNKEVVISIKEVEEKKKVFIKITDTGTGIDNLNAALRLGDRSIGQSPLNEHGFGLKHALASANPDNDSWELCTRTKKDAENGVYRRIKSPYKIDGTFKGTFEEGNVFEDETGTNVSFTCTWDMFETVRSGLSGNYGFEGLCKLIIEEMGFIYSGMIANSQVAIFVKTIPLSGNATKRIVNKVEPPFTSSRSGTQDVDLGNGLVKLNYVYGAIEESDYNRYYKKNMATSGVEIRINGRLMCYNLFEEIWNKEKHNSYNYFIGIFDIISTNKDSLPKTKTSKNGLREGDSRLVKLYETIHGILPEIPEDPNSATHETELFEILADRYRQYNPQMTVEVELPAYVSLGAKKTVRVDLYRALNGEVIIYEGKIQKTTAKDAYQLLMYWDGLVSDGITPTKGILIAEEHPSVVQAIIDNLNNNKDANGNYYRLETKQWVEELPDRKISIKFDKK